MVQSGASSLAYMPQTSSNGVALSSNDASISSSNNNNNNNNSGSVGVGGGKYAEEPSSFYGSVVDQLHAEQKSTIEALSCQVEFYRQREERYKKEVDTLRKYVTRKSGSGASGDDGDARAQAFAQLAAENRSLGEETDALRRKQSAWEQEKLRLERTRYEAESQLKDAKHSLTGFSQAIEQLELKMQRKEAEVQTRCLELEQQLRIKTSECERLAEEQSAAQQTIQNLQTASAENQRLRAELQALAQSSVTQKSETEATKQQMQRSLDASRREQEQTIAELKQQLADSGLQLASVKLEIGAKQSEVKELQLQLENAKNLFSMREKLLASEDHSRKDGESQRQELLALVSTLQREKEALKGDLSTQRQELDALRSELRSVKSRLSSKDHGVMVSTLRSEISYLKERLRNEFKHEKDELKSEKVTLSQEISALNGHLVEKERHIQRLQGELLERDEKSNQLSFDLVHLRERVNSLETEVESARVKYQQLQDCRTSLAEKLDFGFKELLNDEESAASAYEELEKLHKEVGHLKKQNATLGMQRQTAVDELDRVRIEATGASSRLNAKIDELYRQMREKNDDIAALKTAEQQLALYEREKASWEGQLEDTKSRWERGVEAEARKASDLRSQLSALQEDKSALEPTIRRLQQELRLREEQVQATVAEVQQRDSELAAGKAETSRLKEEIAGLEERLAEATKAIENSRHERSSREKKLLRERKRLESEMMQLFGRIEAAGKRNLELGEKVIVLANQAKVDQTDLVAMSSQVKIYKQKIRHLEDQLTRMSRNTSRESESVHDLKHRLSDTRTLIENYESEIAKLRTAIEQVHNEKDVVVKQRDEAVKRVRLLMQCQEQMKSTVEGHTTELVEEIEALQDQLENERKRCTVLLSNEKALLRDLNERNSSIAKLQRSVQMLQQPQQRHQQPVASQLRPPQQQQPQHQPKNSYDTNESFSRSSTTATTAATTSNSPHGSSPRLHTQHQQQRISVPSSFSAPAKELDHLLSNLERISNFSAQQQRY
ncbi:hypothetical protein Gpo141_00013626 [Globisporangium polare]